MAEDGEDWNRLEMMILKSLTIFFSKYTSHDVAPLTLSNADFIGTGINCPFSVEKWLACYETVKMTEKQRTWANVSCSSHI